MELILDSEYKRQIILSEVTNASLADKKSIKIWKKSEIRSLSQNSARWLYLEYVSKILEERGECYTIRGTPVNAPYTKQRLYESHWTASRETIFPGKKGQLNTKEFCQLADYVMDLIAFAFDIHIPFPNIKDKLIKEGKYKEI